MNNILLRSLTGGVFIALVIVGLALNTYTAVAVMGLFTLLGLWEYFTLLNKKNEGTSPLLGTIFGVFVFLVLTFMWQFPLLPFSLLALPIFVAVIELFRKKKAPLNNVASVIFSWFYIVLPLFLLVFLCGCNHAYQPIIPIGMLLIVWSNDTFAYLFGRFFGKTPLFERISPKKTWEGTIGGLIFAMLTGFVIAYFSGIDWKYWVIGATVIVPAAIFGDLFESLVKRSLNIKDSGTILPGHGGILDRFDATLFATPLFFIFHQIYMYF